MSDTDREITESAFDAEALSYDAIFEDNPVTARIRPIIWESMLRVFRPGDHILDITCGTGTDAIMLARHGIRVTAADASEGMIRAAEAKRAAHHCGNLIGLRRLPLQMLGTIGGGPYDGAISNFGGLNCVDDPAPVLRELAGLLKPGSRFVACLLNRVCLWEIGTFLIRGKFRRAFRRLSSAMAPAALGGSTILVRYHSPSAFDRIASPWFRAERRYGINILSPTPNSRTFTARHPHMTDRLLAIDDRIRERRPWSSLGDHFVVEYRRVDAR